MQRRLSDYSSGRDNNFNLIRLIAASMVLVSHSFTLATGRPDLEPFSREIGITFGSMAVDIFFVTSGFLVTGSLISRKNILEFFLARALRIYPGLWVSQVVTVVIVGLWFSSLSSKLFFTEWTTWHSFLKNCVLIRGVDASFPGAFETVPFKQGGANSSLWTLPVELGMYIKLGISWLVLGLVRRYGGRLFVAFCVGVAALSTLLDLFDYINPSWDFLPLASGWTLTSKFFTGATLRLLQSRVVASRWVAGFMMLVLVASIMNLFCFGIAYKLVLPYLVIYVALVPSLGRFRFLTKGDYSYGIYIYAYPIQQSIATVIKNIPPFKMFVLAYPITFLFAFASWHLVEKHSLKFKEHLGRSIPAIFRTPAPRVKAQ
jgi:peptidoglycan/LPS O-acetylase OafA/YrhL